MRKYTIIIPTKDRFETLKWTVESCLNINYPNFEIVISDNCSEDETQLWIQELDHPKIKYFRTPCKMGMSANWEFALSKVNEGMITILGDDDALLPDSLNRIEFLLNKYQLDAISWKQAFYRWPNNDFVRIKNLLSLPIKKGTEIRNCKTMLQNVVNLNSFPADLPWLYGGFVDCKYINLIKQQSNRQFFHSKIPDIYSAIVLSSVIEEYVFSYEPFSIAGHSAKSNGSAQIQVSSDFSEQNENFLKESETHPFHPSLEFVHVYPILIWESVMQAMDIGVLRPGIILNKQFLLDYALRDCVNLDFIKRDAEKLRKIAELHNLELKLPSSNWRIGLKKWWNLYANYVSVWTNSQFIDCGYYKIANVSDASRLYRSLEAKANSRWNIIYHNIKLLIAN